ncbi:MAG: DPP IV N-terminal domain-containing protein [Alloprevotella sp.]
MIKKIFLAVLALLALQPSSTMAQTKRSFTLEEIMWGGKDFWSHRPAGHFSTFWGDRMVELSVEEVKTLSDAKGRLGKAATLFTLDDVNAAIDTTKTKPVYALYSAQFPEAGKTLALLQTSTANLLYDWKTKQIVWQGPRVSGSSHNDFTYASRSEAFVKDWNLYVTTADGKTHQVSTDGSRELQYGQSVHRDEFGIHKGTFWSPKGHLLAFYRMDQTMVTDFPLVDNEPRVATLAPEKYPMAGMTSHKVTVGVYNPATDQTVYLQAGDPTDRYFTNIAWSPDEKTVYVIEVPRSQDKAELVSYDAATGRRLAVLYTETNARYVEPCNPIVFLPWDSSKFVYQTRRDGYNHLYLFDTTGKELAQLTKGAFEVIEMLGFNETTRSIIIKANADSPIAHNIYAVNVKSGKRTRLDNGQGVHHAKLSAGGRYMIDTWNAPDVYRHVDLASTAAPSAVNVWADDKCYEEFNMPEITSGTIKAADGTTDLYYRLVKPVDFDPNKTYPAIVYVYGGPHAHLVDASWDYSARPWEYYMAQRGYVMFVLDSRGSEYRGFEFESCTHRHLGDNEMKDQLEGVKFLKSLPYVDGNRLGVHGWSFGGFMTTNLMCSYPDVFKVGVAGGPVIDWKYYEVMYGERYMDTPQENPEGYESSSLLPKAKNLKGRLQVIVGYNDPTCVLQHSLSFLKACEDAGTQPDYFVYPGEGHNMAGHMQVHLHDRITRYFDDYLK